MQDYHKPDFDTLTPREMSALRGICAGLSTAETGARLGLAGQTVKNMLRLVYARLGLSGLTGHHAPRACYLLALHEMRRLP